MRSGVSLRLSVTDRCQQRCLYCMPPEGLSKVPREEVLTFEEMARFVRMLKESFGLRKVRLTGGEPLVRAGVAKLVAMLAAEGIEDLALTTNGQLLAPMAGELRAAGVRRVNVSLDTLDAARFRRVTHGGELQRTLEGIEAALGCGLTPVKLNMVVLRGVNDDEVEAMARFGLERGCEVRFLELMPIGPAAERFGEWFVPAAEVRGRLARCFRLSAEDGGEGAACRTFRAVGRGVEGIVGFIASQTSPFCDGCLRLRLTATGRLLGCLAQEEGVDVRRLLRSASPPAEDEWAEAVRAALRLKRRTRFFERQQPMARVGG